ncbi:TRAP transporter small permease [Halomonas sp. HL-93]|uniref:TRAP transporter small permease n=1 Tax=Halomonas sp. HL-93 TaxID=1666906 RepID=UPI0006DB32E9|nr:TRAP transporter small permease [Halomonas sp. HL-93]KPQ21832.1 MAG: TRAP-type galacturonate uptake system small permease component [Halomonas sp. HL-93]SBR45060.1 TRAP-type C4-dicarboxylate transport system, small permease component [Halomonas sp. HL-93]
MNDISETHPDPADKEPSLLDKVLDGAARTCLIIAGVLLVLLIILFGWLVFGRYVLNNTPTWVEQASLLIVVYITFLGAAAGVRNNSHLNIEFIREGLPAFWNKLFHAIADLFVIGFGIFMTHQGSLLVLNNLERAIPMIGLSESWRAAPLVICGVLMVVFATADMLGRVTNSRLK